MCHLNLLSLLFKAVHLIFIIGSIFKATVLTNFLKG